MNLKRPTLRLSPLAPAEDAAQTGETQDNHGIEFEFDCDAPKCGIAIHVVLAPDHPLAKKGSTDGSKVLVFETTVDGGFAKILKLDEGATLELGAFEPRPTVDGSHGGKDTSASNASIGEPATPVTDDTRKSRRFTTFVFRKRQQASAVAGPALAVVDVDQTDKDKDGSGMPATDDGVRICIRLSALDKEGEGLPSTNEQTTYLQVVRMGAAPAASEEDTRPWVVKVVKREAAVRLT